MNTVAELEKKSREIELHAIDYLDAQGKYTINSKKPLYKVVFTFIDGSKIEISAADMHLMTDKMEFKLRPIQDHS